MVKYSGNRETASCLSYKSGSSYEVNFEVGLMVQLFLNQAYVFSLTFAA